MKRCQARVIIGAAVCVLLLITFAHAGIRVDGTEFQTASDVAERSITARSPDTLNQPVKIVLTLAQAVMARGEQTGGPSAAFKIGLGYEYNVLETSYPTCACWHQCDFDDNSVLDAVDLNGEIDALFYNGSNPQDEICPTTRADFNNDGFPDATDLNQLIDHLFFNGDAPVNPCQN